MNAQFCAILSPANNEQPGDHIPFARFQISHEEDARTCYDYLACVLTSLALLFGRPQRLLILLNLVFGILGFLEFLILSVFLLSFSAWGGRATEIHTPGPGFWLMLSGFPLCIGSSIIALHREIGKITPSPS